MSIHADTKGKGKGKGKKKDKDRSKDADAVMTNAGQARNDVDAEVEDAALANDNVRDVAMNDTALVYANMSTTPTLANEYSEDQHEGTENHDNTGRGETLPPNPPPAYPHRPHPGGAFYPIETRTVGQRVSWVKWCLNRNAGLEAEKGNWTRSIHGFAPGSTSALNVFQVNVMEREIARCTRDLRHVKDDITRLVTGLTAEEVADVLIEGWGKQGQYHRHG